MDEPLLASESDDAEKQQQQHQQQQQRSSRSFCTVTSYLPVAWTSIPPDINAPGKLLGSIGLEWM
jgi:hypothetical protein